MAEGVANVICEDYPQVCICCQLAGVPCSLCDRAADGLTPRMIGKADTVTDLRDMGLG